MTYAEFLLWFLVVPILVLIGATRWLQRRGRFAEVDSRYHWRGVAILAVIAFVWTTPWDNYLIARGVWDSPPDRIIGKIGYVPLEEYAFFLLMPIFNGALIYWLLPGLPRASAISRTGQKWQRVSVVLIAGILFSGGLYALAHERGTYLGLILVWFTPPLLIQWLFDPGALLRGRNVVLWGTLLPTLYFALADSFAIGQGIWVIASTPTTGLELLGLPFEEILFFAITSLLLAQGLVLWYGLRQSDPVR